MQVQVQENDNGIGDVSSESQIKSSEKSKKSSDQIIGTSNAKACVRHSEGKPNQCEAYPCDVLGNPLSMDEGLDPSMEDKAPPFGYAGRFVHREDGVERSSMQIGGGGSWDSGCAISHKYKFVYIHVLKSGGSALKTFIRRSFCGEDDPQCDKADRQIISPIACTVAVRKHPDYFFWSFVRNPFSRMYSMYSMMEGFPRRGKSFADFSFDQFILHPEERSKYTKMSPSHYVPQTSFLFDRNGCPAIDFLGRVEHFDEDMNVLLKHLNVPELDAQMKLQGGTMKSENTWGTNGKKSRLGGDLRNAYHSQELVDKAVGTYSRDFQLLGFDPDKSAVPIN